MKHVLTVLCLAMALPALAAENPLTDSPTWEDMRVDVTGDVALQDGSALFSVDAPYRAEDAATVPVVITQTDPEATISSATVVVDENPAPVAGTFAFGPAMHPLKMELRVRVDQYSNLRVIAETDRRQLHGGPFRQGLGRLFRARDQGPVRGACRYGGDAAETLQTRRDAAIRPKRREAQVMIRHPNYSGLQRDQLTQLFIPAHFIHQLEVYQGDEKLFTMEGGISISENPVFRFDYTDNGAPDLRIRAVDTDGNVFDQLLPKAAS